MEFSVFGAAGGRRGCWKIGRCRSILILPNGSSAFRILRVCCGDWLAKEFRAFMAQFCQPWVMSHSLATIAYSTGSKTTKSIPFRAQVGTRDLRLALQLYLCPTCCTHLGSLCCVQHEEEQRHRGCMCVWVQLPLLLSESNKHRRML